MDISDKALTRIFRDTLQKAIHDDAEEIIKEAQEKLAEAIRKRIGTMCLKMASGYSMERMGDIIRIEAKVNINDIS